MAGIYIHIPYCTKACHYCDFHFSTNLSAKDKMVDMICQEIALRHDYLSAQPISTLYFGGGTPSLLSEVELKKIMEAIHHYFNLETQAEITLEANPDDITTQQLKTFQEVGINRLSIGIQTFHNPALQFMNRSHHAAQAETSVKLSQDSGIHNISIDLIYGVPAMDHSIWENDLAKAVKLQIPHISSYCLTIEPDTVFGRRKEKGILAPEDEEFNAQQFEILIQTLEESGYEQYEVSNFSKPGFISRHNSSYWHGEFYLGIGPGAHSYNGHSRQFNVENNIKYMSSLAQNKIPSSLEILDPKTKANEYIMTRLRTKWGIDSNVLEEQFGIPFDNIRYILEKYLKEGLIQQDKTTIKLSKKGLLLADKITEDLFII